MGLLWLQFALIVLLILANGFFAASEIAIVSARRGRLQQRAEAGSRQARAALRLAQEPNRFLATVQVGISLIGTFAAAFGGDVPADPLARSFTPVLGEQYAHLVALTLVVLLLTYLSLILGELAPKRLALQHAETIATIVAPIMQVIARIAAPIVWFLTISTEGVLRLLGRSGHQEDEVTEDDVLSLVREGTEAGAIKTIEQELIERVFDFADCPAHTIMTPRTEIQAVALDTPLPEAAQQAMASGYSRIPVYQDSLDTVVGVLHVKDLLRVFQQQRDDSVPPQTVREVLRPPVFVLASQRVVAVPQQLKQARTHLALVLDEYGQIAGLLTLEDVLEELAGDIADEHDEAESKVVPRPDGSFLVEGLLSYADGQRHLDLPPRTESDDLPDFDTVAGLILALLGHIPKTGETTSWHDWQFEVVDMDGVRIDKILVCPPQGNQRSRGEGALALGAVLPPPWARSHSIESHDGGEGREE